MQPFFVDLERRQVVEHEAVPPAIDGRVDPFGREAVIACGVLRLLNHATTGSAAASRIGCTTASGRDTASACEAPSTALIRCARARSAMWCWRAAGMLRSSSPN